MLLRRDGFTEHDLDSLFSVSLCAGQAAGQGAVPVAVDGVSDDPASSPSWSASSASISTASVSGAFGSSNSSICSWVNTQRCERHVRVQVELFPPELDLSGRGWRHRPAVAVVVGDV